MSSVLLRRSTAVPNLHGKEGSARPGSPHKLDKPCSTYVGLSRNSVRLAESATSISV
jgi:hypothetical protein